MSRALTRRRHGKYRVFNRLRRAGSDAQAFVTAEAARLGCPEENIYDAMHLGLSEPEFFTFEQVQSSADGVEFGCVDPGTLLAVKLNGINENYQKVGPLPMGNVWSVSFWANPDFLEPVNNDGLFSQESIVPLAFETIKIQVGPLLFGPGTIFISLSRNTGVGIKSFQWATVLTVGVWTHLVATWDGANLLLYIDSVNTVPSVKTLDGAGVMLDTPPFQLKYGKLRTGNPFEGNLGHLGIWDVALPSGDVGEIFAGKFSIDLRNNTGSYTSSADLIGYWRPGFSDVGFTDLSGVTGDFTGTGIDGTNIVTSSP